jgi:PAS domain S-box-containing protein
MDTSGFERSASGSAFGEEKYAAAFKASPDSITITRLSDGEILEGNEGFERLLGYARAECIGKTTAELAMWADPADRDALARSLGDTGGVRDFETTLRRKGGALVAVTVSARIIYLQGEECFLSVVRDVTERKQAETRSDSNSRRVQALLELNQMVGSSRKEISDFALEEAVAVTASTIGYLAFLDESETILTMYSWSTTAMDECSIADKPIEYAVQSTGLWGEAVRQRHAVVTNDYAADNPLKKGYPAGHVALRRHMCVPVFDGSRIVAVAGVGNKEDDYDLGDVQQLTLLMEGMWRLLERRRIDDALHENQMRLDLALRSAEMGVWNVDIQENKRSLDEQVCRLLSIDAATFGGTADEFFAAIHPDDVEMVKAALERTVSHGAPCAPEYRVVWTDGSVHWIIARGSLARDEQGRPSHINGVLWDATERKQAEQKIHDLARSLEERVAERTRELDETIGQLTEANEAKTRFLRSMSHELRTPLNSIIGFTGVIQQGLAGPVTEEQTRQLAMIRNSGRHLLALINDILDLSRIDAGAVEVHPEPIDVGGLLVDLVSECGASACAKGLELTSEVSDPAPRLSSDPVKLRQILLNLVSNAIKFTDTGQVVLRASRPSAHVVELTVSDTGPGIAPEEWEHIFGEFERGVRQDPTVEGTGLGLAISRGLAGSLGGTLAVSSEVGTGSTFTLTLPEALEIDKE